MASPDEDNIHKDNITMKRSTFTKLLVVGIVSLMIASFFGGYTWRATFYPSTANTVVQTAGNIPQQPGLTAQQSQQQQPPQIIKISSLDIQGSPVRGTPDAPITMVEFGDFQCPFCSRFATDTLQQLIKNYVDTGKIKFVYKEYPLPFHSNAQPSALAAECANEQGKFWVYHDKLYASQTTWENQDSNTVKNTFKQYAISLGLNPPTFNSCLDSSKYNDKIQKESSEGSQYGVSGTPTFYIGNNKAGYTQIVGAQPLGSFEQMIKQVPS